MKLTKKKCVLIILVVFIVFFAIATIHKWFLLTEEYQKCMNKEYAIVEDIEFDLNEYFLEMHDNYSVKYKMMASAVNGLVLGAFAAGIVSYLCLLYWLFTSKEEKKITIAWVLVVLALVCIFIYWYFVANFKIVF